MVHRIKLQVCFQEAASGTCDWQAMFQACIAIQSWPAFSCQYLASALISADEMDTRLENSASEDYKYFKDLFSAKNLHKATDICCGATTAVDLSLLSLSYSKGLNSWVTRKQWAERKKDEKIEWYPDITKKNTSTLFSWLLFHILLRWQARTIHSSDSFFSKSKISIDMTVTPAILLSAKHQKQGEKSLNCTGSLLHLASETAQTPGTNDAQPCLQRAKPKASWEQNSPWGFGRPQWEKAWVSSQLLTFTHNLHKLCFQACSYFFEVHSLLFSLVFLLTHLCFLLLAGPGRGSAEHQEWIQPRCWLRYGSPCSSDFAAAFQISVPEKIQMLI